jgi:hypothetical protein
MAWPSPESNTVTVVCGPASVVSLPRRGASELDAQLRPFEAPETGTPLASTTTMLRDGGRRIRRDLSNAEVEVEFDWHGSRTRIVATNTEMGEDNIARYRIVEGDPLTAAVFCRVEVSLSRPGWNTVTRATSSTTSQIDQFLVTSTLDAFEDGVRVHSRTWTHRFSRDGT